MNQPINRVLDAIRAKGFEPLLVAGQWKCQCPSHEDSTPSLAIRELKNGKVVLRCFAGCQVADIIGAIGLKWGDLFLNDKHVPKRKGGKPFDIEREYDYVDEAGELLYQVVRLKPKDFRQRKPNGNGGWEWKLNGVRRVPYQLPKLIGLPAGSSIFVVEGEKDADRLNALGLQATTNAQGAGRWSSLHPQTLAHAFSGKRVIVLPDNDPPGLEHAEEVAKSLTSIASEVKILHLPHLPDKGDVSDWLNAGGTVEAIHDLVSRCPPWTLPTCPKFAGTPESHDDVYAESEDIDNSMKDDDRPVVLGPDEHRVVDEVIGRLTTDDELFQRAGQFVRVELDKETGCLFIAQVKQADLRRRITSTTRLANYKPDAKNKEGKYILQHPPNWLTPQVAEHPNKGDIRRLAGVKSVPILRADGSIHAKAGYDPLTCLFFRPGDVDFPPMLSSPTQADAFWAAACLRDLIQDFPLASEYGYGVYLSLILSSLARHLIEGGVPLHLVDSNLRGTGKGLLIDSVGIIVLGTFVPTQQYSADPIEMRKLITSIVMAGKVMVYLDNLPNGGAFGNASLDSVLTSTVWEDRILGQNAQVTLPHKTVWCASGNNVILRADAARRIVRLRLESAETNPEDRTDFKYPDLLALQRKYLF